MESSAAFFTRLNHVDSIVIVGRKRKERVAKRCCGLVTKSRVKFVEKQMASVCPDIYEVNVIRVFDPERGTKCGKHDMQTRMSMS